MSKIIIKNIEIEVDIEGGFDKQADVAIIADDYADFRQGLEDLIDGMATSHNIAKNRFRVKHVPFRDSGLPFA